MVSGFRWGHHDHDQVYYIYNDSSILNDCTIESSYLGDHDQDQIYYIYNGSSILNDCTIESSPVFASQSMLIIRYFKSVKIRGRILYIYFKIPPLGVGLQSISFWRFRETWCGTSIYGSGMPI